MKTATEQYVTIKLFYLAGSVGIPTGKKRTAGDGAIEAEFFLIYSNHPERKVWLRRQDIF